VDELWQTIVKMLPFLLAGMVVPSWTKYVILLLATSRPKLNASAFVLGNATFRLLLGFFSLYVFQINYVDEQTSNPPGGESTWLIVPGLLLIGLAVYLFRRKPERETDELPGWLTKFSSINPWVAFLGGFIMVALPGVQYVYFLGGVGVIAKSSLDAVTSLILLILFVLCLELMLITPIVIFAATGERGEMWMQKAKVWIGKHESQVIGVVIFFFGGFLLFLGIQSAMAA
jgi:hypothetical protein